MTALRASRPAGEDAGAGRRADRHGWAEANINPATGLSTDYLNHFNEAVMLLEMIPVMPECADDLAAWQPRSYREHFAGSRLKHRGLAIAAYDAADPMTRRQLDLLCSAMNAAVIEARESLRRESRPDRSARVAARVVAWLKPRMARASAIIHGDNAVGRNRASIQGSQAAVDAIFCILESRR